MNKYQHIDILLEAMKKDFLKQISKKDCCALDSLSKARIKLSDSEHLQFDFEVYQLFDALWLWAKEQGFALPNARNWEKEVKYFCQKLMNPWPMDAFSEAGLDITHQERSAQIYRNKYKIVRK